MKGGVEIILEAGVRIPNWIRNQTRNVKIGRKKIHGKNVRILRVRGAEAGFIPGGAVDLRMPGSDEFWVPFGPLKVLQIRDLKDNLIKQNYLLCENCFTNTGKVKSSKISSNPSLVDSIFQCTECGHEWELKGI